MTDYRESFVEEAVELVIPPPVNVAQLMRFIHELERTLHDKYASIINNVLTGNLDLEGLLIGAILATAVGCFGAGAVVLAQHINLSR